MASLWILKNISRKSNANFSIYSSTGDKRKDLFDSLFKTSIILIQKLELQGHYKKGTLETHLSYDIDLFKFSTNSSKYNLAVWKIKLYSTTKPKLFQKCSWLNSKNSFNAICFINKIKMNSMIISVGVKKAIHKIQHTLKKNLVANWK